MMASIFFFLLRSDWMKRLIDIIVVNVTAAYVKYTDGSYRAINEFDEKILTKYWLDFYRSHIKA